MNMRTLAAIGVGFATGVAQADLTNGSFESGTGADADAWNEIEVFGGTGGATASADRTFGMGRTGDYAMVFNVSGAPDFGPVAEIQQLPAAGFVVGGQEYNFSFWAMGTPGPGSVAFYEVLWFDSDGSDGGGPQGTATGLQAFSYGDTYSEFTMTGLIAPTSADSVLVQIRLVTGAFDGAAGSLVVDDVSFALVPAPGVLALAGFGGLVGLRRRR